MNLDLASGGGKSPSKTTIGRSLKNPFTNLFTTNSKKSRNKSGRYVIASILATLAFLFVVCVFVVPSEQADAIWTYDYEWDDFDSRSSTNESTEDKFYYDAYFYSDSEGFANWDGETIFARWVCIDGTDYVSTELTPDINEYTGFVLASSKGEITLVTEKLEIDEMTRYNGENILYYGTFIINTHYNNSILAVIEINARCHLIMSYNLSEDNSSSIYRNGYNYSEYFEIINCSEKTMTFRLSNEDLCIGYRNSNSIVTGIALEPYNPSVVYGLYDEITVYNSLSVAFYLVTEEPSDGLQFIDNRLQFEIVEDVDGGDFKLNCLGPIEGYNPSGEVDLADSLYDSYHLYASFIADGAFRGCDLTSVKLSDIESIGNGAFAGCDKLETVIITSESAPTIGIDAFDTGTMISVTTGGWDPVEAFSSSHGVDTTILWANPPEFPELIFTSDPNDPLYATITYSKP